MHAVREVRACAFYYFATASLLYCVDSPNHLSALLGYTYEFHCSGKRADADEDDSIRITKGEYGSDLTHVLVE